MICSGVGVATPLWVVCAASRGRIEWRRSSGVLPGCVGGVRNVVEDWQTGQVPFKVVPLATIDSYGTLRISTGRAGRLQLLLVYGCVVSREVSR